MTYVIASVYVALSALYVAFAATGRPGVAAWCVTAALALSMAAILLSYKTQQGLIATQSRLIDDLMALSDKKTDLMRKFADKAGVLTEFDAVVAEAREQVLRERAAKASKAPSGA